MSGRKASAPPRMVGRSVMARVRVALVAGVCTVVAVVLLGVMLAVGTVAALWVATWFPGLD